MAYRRERVIPTTSQVARLLDALTSLEQQAECLRAELTGPRLPTDPKLLGKVLGKIMSSRELLYQARRELTSGKETA
jgi:hypothetical protein